MFPSFISILDIQSWWEVPSIAHFCSLFRAAFNLLDFDIEELEEALLTDGTEDSGSSLLQELIVRLLCGCLGNNDVSTFNYQMFLRRLFRQKCQEHGRYNPFNTDIDFQFLPLRTKVEILHALCDFRLDADDVLDLLKNLEAESLRVEPLGYDDNDSAYWYFYGTRLYREDYEKGSKKSKHKKSVWQVVCFTEQDWNHLTSKFKGATSKTEKALYRSLSENFLPEIPRLFQEKERQQRKRLLELQPRRSSSRVQKQRALEEEAALAAAAVKEATAPPADNELIKSSVTLSARELRAIQRDIHKSGSGSEADSRAESPAMPSQKSNSSGLTTVGRQTNNSLASATGQILIQASTQRKKLKTSQIFRQTEEDLQTGMYKILEYVKNHDDAWPFIEPVEEDYAPNYYSIVRKPMDLQRMEDKLDAGEYLTFSRFKADFQLIVDNCRLYNGTDNEYTEMVDNLQQAFQRATDRFLDQITSSDEEIELQNSVKENVTNTTPPVPAITTTTKKSKRGRKENKITSKRKSSPVEKLKPVAPTQQHKTGGRHKTKTPTSEIAPEVRSKKTKLSKKERFKEKEKAKSEKSSNIESGSLRKNKKNKPIAGSRSERSVTRSRSRSRSRSNIRSWTSSPSPPPPRIQKKKRNKEKNSKVPESESPATNNTERSSVNIEKLNELLAEKNKKNIIEKKPSLIMSKNDFEKKEKNSQLRETIEKLKQNSLYNKKEHLENCKPKIRDTSRDKAKIKYKSKEKLKENTIKDSIDDIEIDSCNTKDSGNTLSTVRKNSHGKKVKKAGVIKNPAAIKALDLATEQTLKDINKWLDDTPKFSELSSPSNSPLPLSNMDEFDIAASNLESDYKLNQQKIQKQAISIAKPKEPAKDSLKRKTLAKDFTAKLQKRREIQRTIDRLQPGKSKGNLIANIQSIKNDDSAFPSVGLSKTKDSKVSTNGSSVSESTPKLSLGTVLDSFGEQHNFVDDEKPAESELASEAKLPKEESVENVKDKSGEEKEKLSEPCKKEEAEERVIKVHKQENVTPNLSAWFKAFGAPKTSAITKKKTDQEIDSSKEAENVISPVSSDERLQKPSSELAEDLKKVPSPMPSPAPEILIGQQQPMPRMRKASTGSSVSERSSFSQDMTDPLDSPRLSVDERLGMYSAPYPSPLHRSPAGASPVMSSPHMDDTQRNSSYPPLNGNIRVGFYQDTVKSSPEKSCSPRDQPHSPHPQYPQHVYIPPSSTATYQYSNPPSCSDSSPAQSPIYSQPSTSYPPPPYSSNHNLINPYYESAKSLEYDNGKALENYDHPQSPVSTPVAENLEHIPQTTRAEVKSHTMNNTVIPVKKRLYSETAEIDNSARLPSAHALNVPRMHDVSMYTNTSRAIMDANLMSQARQLNLNPEPLSMTNKAYLAPSSAQLDTIPKNYSISSPGSTLSEISNRSSDNTRLIDVSSRGLNLQIPNTEPLNIPNPATIKTIDLTGPESPIYSRQHAMNMPLDVSSTMDHKAEQHLYQRVPNSGSTVEMAQLPQYTRLESVKTKASDTSPDGKQIAYVRGMPVDITARNQRLNLASADLRIPAVRTESSQGAGQELSAHKRISLPSGISLDIGNGNIANAHPFTPPSTIGLDSRLRENLASLSHIVDRYQSDERLLSTLSNNPYYADKNLSATASSLFPKTISSSIHAPNSVSSPHSILSPNTPLTTASMYIPTTLHQQPIAKVNPAQSVPPPSSATSDKKSKKRKSKSSSPATIVSESNQGFQSYSGLKTSSNNIVSSEPSAISLKTTSVVPGSAFNFGPASSTLNLSSSIYNDKDSFSGFLDEYRNPTTNFYMTAAAAAAHHRSTPEIGTEKTQRSTVPPQTNPTGGSFAYLGHPQSRPTTYSPFMNPHQPSPLIEPTSPLYQQYLQRHQEELLRHSSVLHQGLLGPPTAYPAGYPLGMRQPFDAINRPSWL